MEQLLDFLVRLGEVTLGIVAAIIWIVIAFAVIIEIVDFLVVDPLRRKTDAETTETEEV